MKPRAQSRIRFFLCHHAGSAWPIQLDNSRLEKTSSGAHRTRWVDSHGYFKPPPSTKESSLQLGVDRHMIGPRDPPPNHRQSSLQLGFDHHSSSAPPPSMNKKPQAIPTCPSAPPVNLCSLPPAFCAKSPPWPRPTAQKPPRACISSGGRSWPGTKKRRLCPCDQFLYLLGGSGTVLYPHTWEGASGQFLYLYLEVSVLCIYTTWR